MSLRPQNNSDLEHAFPSNVRNDVLVALSALPDNPHGVGSFTAQVNGEAVSIPYRVYHDTTLIHVDKLSSLQIHLIDCVLTRHNDGILRQKHLVRMVTSGNPWVPPFVVQLVGEYVVEIIQVIAANLSNLNVSLYARFLRANPDFLALTEQRVTSYWDCYHRSTNRGEYVGFRVLDFFKGLVVAKE